MLLGVTEGQNSIKTQDQMSEEEREDWQIGKELIKTCVETYFKTVTGLAPEIVEFSEDLVRGERDWVIPHYNP